jgi:hypothetical protein
MTELIVRVEENKKKLIEELLKELGCEVNETNVSLKSINKKKVKEISPTFLFGKWKDVDIDPIKYRDKIWKRS